MTVRARTRPPSTTISTCLAPDTNLCDARSLEEGPATRPRRGRQAEAGAIGVERERRAEPHRRRTHRGPSPFARSPADPLRVQARRLARLVLAPQHLSVVARSRPSISSQASESAPDAEPPDERRRVERRPPPAFEDAPRVRRPWRSETSRNDGPGSGSSNPALRPALPCPMRSASIRIGLRPATAHA